MGRFARALLVGSLPWAIAGCGGSAGQTGAHAGSPADAAADGGSAAAGEDGAAPDDAHPGQERPARPAPRFTSVGPLRARFTAIVATPTAVFAATEASVHRSRDGGDSWTLLKVPELSGVTAMVARGAELFVAGARQAIYHSTDDGETWRRQTRGGYASHLSVHGSELYMLTDGAPYRWNAPAQAWEALEKEATEAIGGFDALDSDGTTLYANQRSRGGLFRLDPGTPGARWTRISGPDIGYVVAFAFFDGEGFAAGAPILRRGAGDNWTPLATRFEQTTDLFFDRGTLYAAGADGLHASADRGATWTRVVSDHFISSTALVTQGETLFAAGTAVWRKRRDGAWQALALRADGIRMLHATSGSVLSVSDSGLLRWQAGHWEKIVGLDEDRVRPLTSIVDHGGEVLVATSQILASVDGGRSFVHRPSVQGHLDFIASTGAGLVIGVGPSGHLGNTVLHRSTDGARTWTALPPVARPGYIGTLVFRGLLESQGTLFLLSRYQSDGVHRSTDDGQTWSQVSADGWLSPLVAVGGVLLAADAKGGVMRSADRGETWQRSGLDGLPVSSFAVRDGAVAVVFAGVGGDQGFAGGVHLSTDLGRTWNPVDPAFDARVSALAIQGDRLFAGTRDQATWSAPLP